MNYSRIAILGAGLCVLAVPASAQERELVGARVKLEDLDLDRPTGLSTARDRVAEAARRACGPNNRAGLKSTADHDACLQQVRGSGERHIAAVAAEQRQAEEQRIAAARAQAERQAAARRPAVRQAQTNRYRSCSWPKKYAYKKRVCVWRNRR